MVTRTRPLNVGPIQAPVLIATVQDTRTGRWGYCSGSNTWRNGELYAPVRMADTNRVRLIRTRSLVLI
jgi:hypothetical protein